MRRQASRKGHAVSRDTKHLEGARQFSEPSPFVLARSCSRSAHPFAHLDEPRPSRPRAARSAIHFLECPVTALAPPPWACSSPGSAGPSGRRRPQIAPYHMRRKPVRWPLPAVLAVLCRRQDHRFLMQRLTRAGSPRAGRDCRARTCRARPVRFRLIHRRSSLRRHGLLRGRRADDGAEQTPGVQSRRRR